MSKIVVYGQKLTPCLRISGHNAFRWNNYKEYHRCPYIFKKRDTHTLLKKLGTCRINLFSIR